VAPNGSTISVIKMSMTQGDTALANSDSATQGGSTEQIIAALTEVVKFIFSWVILLPIAVIVSGKLLSARLKLSVSSEQIFKIAILRVLIIQATGAEVVLGLTGFIATLAFVGLFGGKPAYYLFRDRFGVDPGQFNSLCVLSSFALVIWTIALSALIALIYWLNSVRHTKRTERDALITKLSQRKRR
jgi:hypothetical protein